MNTHWSACLLALVFLFPVVSSAQPAPDGPADDTIGSFIKEWRWESADGRSALDVSSSSLMLFDGNLYGYELSDGALRFVAGGSSVPYSYDDSSDRLTLNFGDTAQVEYHRTIQSVLARRGTRRLPEQAEFLFGRYATGEQRLSDGASEQRTINFHANTEFDFGPRGSTTAGGVGGGAGSPAALGTALVYEDVIIFSFYDSSAAEAEVQTRGSRGDIRSFIYADERYTRVPYEAALNPTPTPYPVPEPYPGPPPSLPPPLDPPYYPPYYPPYHPPVYYPPYDPPVVVGGQLAPPHAGGGKGGKGGGDTRTIGTHRDRGNSGSGAVRSPGRSSGSGGSSTGGSSSGGRGGSSGGSSRGGSRR